MEQYITISVRRIAITASDEDVRSYFARNIPGGDPIVKFLVNEANGSFRTATVTFKGKTKADCKNTIEKLKDLSSRTLLDGTGTLSVLDFDGDFFGLTVLANRCAVDENPHFDVIFVHGLGGHAHDSFRYKTTDHRRSNMWARDTLPDSLDRPGKKGRYLTFGYPAPLLDSDAISQSVKDTAMELLRKILDDRGNRCDRPLFFVCHSLGGLVVCQAVLLALKSTENNTYHRDYQKAFYNHGQTMIAGILFFGTPFKGSRVANLSVGLATKLRLPLNRTHIMYLRVEDKNVADFVDEFDKLTQQIGLPLLIFFELKKTRKFLFREHVVTRDSARGRFGDQVPKIGLRRDHHSLVKFMHPDVLYMDDVEPRIKELVHNALDAYELRIKFAAFRESSWGTPSLLVPSDGRSLGMQVVPTPKALEAPALVSTPDGSPFKQSGNRARGPLPDSARPELDGPSRAAANAWVEDTIRILKFNQDERRIDDVNVSSAGTCDWILSKTEFQKWNAPLTDTVLFIQGGPGLGKSVLAKYLVQSLKDGNREAGGASSTPAAEQSRKPIVTHFFPRGTELIDVDNSPKAILMNLLYQMSEADPGSVNKAIYRLFNRFNQSRNLDFYWTLFNDVRSIMFQDLYCIVDGLDECIKEFKASQQSIIDERMEGFLIRLCGIARHSSTQEKTSCTKILVTTRPTIEVDNAVSERELVLEIQESDTMSSVERFVEDSVKLLAQRKQLSSLAQDFIQGEIIRKSGHVFQTAQTALTILRNVRYDLEDREVVSRALTSVNSQRSDAAYEETLQTLELAPPQDRIKAARIIRILFFQRGNLSLLELEHALLVDSQDSELTLKPIPIPSALSSFIRNYLALLVNIDNESMVSLQHQTVREYFQNLSEDRWQIYSCIERKAGHLHLALICIRYLILWGRHVVSQGDIDAHKGGSYSAESDKAIFFSYASRSWDIHTREAGELIIPHMQLVNRLLGFDNTKDFIDNFLPMLFVRWCHGMDFWSKDSSFKPLLPGSFLATNGLIHVLRGHTHLRKAQGRGLIQRLMPLRFQAASNESIEADFDLNRQDEGGLGLTPLHCACQNGQFEIARILLDCGASGKVFDANGDSPFSTAVYGDWEEIAEMIIEKNQCWDVQERDSESFTLYQACYCGMSNVVRYLLKIGFKVNTKILGWTPVHVAANGGQAEILEVLLDAGGSPDSATEAGDTPLHIASQKGHLDFVKMLFRYKPDMDPTLLGYDGQSPQHAAAIGGHLDVWEYLEEKRKKVRKDVLPDKHGRLPIHLAALKGHLAIVDRLLDESNIRAPDNDKHLPIHLAAAYGHLEIVQKLIQLGHEVGMSIDVKCRDLSVTVDESPDGLITSLYLAVAQGHAKVAEYLINEGADLNVRSFHQQTLLHEAAGQNISDTFELLLEHGLDPLEKDEALSTPLHFAAEYGSADTVEIYLRMQNLDAILDIVNTNGNWALELAIEKKHAHIAEKLILAGANVHHLYSYKESLLTLSIDLEETTVFKRLIEKGANVNMANVWGETALHRAVEHGKLDVCEMLIGCDANVNAETYICKETPLHYAAGRNNVEIILRLLNAGANPFQRELSGACIMDYVTTHQPTTNLLRKYRNNYQPQANEKHIDVLKQVFCSKLRDMPSTAPIDLEGKVEVDMILDCGFLYASWHLKKYDIYRICFEKDVERSADSKPVPPYECYECWRGNVEGSLWRCKQCPSTELCDECYQKRSKGIYSRGCSADHEFLQIAGDEWRKLEEGKVNAKGQTFWEWIAELKEIYLTGDDVESEACTQQLEKVPTEHVNGMA